MVVKRGSAGARSCGTTIAYRQPLILSAFAGEKETKQVVIDKDDGIRSDFTMQASDGAGHAPQHEGCHLLAPFSAASPAGDKASSTPPLPSPPLPSSSLCAEAAEDAPGVQQGRHHHRGQRVPGAQRSASCAAASSSRASWAVVALPPATVRPPQPLCCILPSQQPVPRASPAPHCLPRFCHHPSAPPSLNPNLPTHPSPDHRRRGLRHADDLPAFLQPLSLCPTPPQTTDGAACVMLMSRAEAERRGLPIMASLRSFAAVGVHPSVMGIGPVSCWGEWLVFAGFYSLLDRRHRAGGWCSWGLGIDAHLLDVWLP